MARSKNGGGSIQVRQADRIRGILESRKDAMSRLLPEYLSPDQMLATVFNELRKTPRLMQCDPASLVNAVMQASQAGLRIGGVEQHGHLVPFKDQVTFVVGYRGMLELARQSGEIQRVATGLVYEGDEFVYSDGIELELRHVPLAEPGDEREAQRVWACVVTKSGGAYAAVLWASQVEKIRNGSAGRNNPAWKGHWGEMAKKTALRRALKLVPMGARLEAAVRNDELVDAGIVPSAEDLGIEDAELVDEQPEEPKSAARSAGGSGGRNRQPDAADDEPPLEEPPEDVDVQSALDLADALDGGDRG